MSKKKKYILISLLVVAVAILIAVIINIKSDKDSTKKVSLIVYGNDVSRWENMRLGAEKACTENGAELTLVNMSDDSNYQEQIYLIEREIAGGADALLIAACDSDQIGSYLDSRKTTIPIIFVENGANMNKEMICVTADDYSMGKALGEELLSRENPIVKVAIISDEIQRESIIFREKGVREIITPYVNEVITWERNDNETNLSRRKFLQRAMLEEAVDVVIALDNDSADDLMDALDNLNKQTKVYAISTSDKSVHYLDHNSIKALECQNEFAIGYVGAQYALDYKNARKKYTNDDIECRVVSKENMYEHENQILLFPFDR